MLRHLRGDVAAVERLDPHERRRRIGAPAHGARARFDRILPAGRGLLKRRVLNLAHHLAGAVPHFGQRREARLGNLVRIRAMHCRDEHVLAIGGRRATQVNSLRAELCDSAFERDDRELRREVVVEEFLVLRTGKEVLERRRRILVAVGFLHDRPFGNLGRGRRDAAAGGNRLTDDVGRVHPRTGIRDRVQREVGEFVRGAGGGIGHPELDAVAAGDREHDLPRIVGPHDVRDLRARRRLNAGFGRASHRKHDQATREGLAPRSVGAGIHARSREPEVRRADVTDRRQSVSFGHEHFRPIGAERSRGRGRRVEDLGDGSRGLLVRHLRPQRGGDDEEQCEDTAHMKARKRVNH